MLLHSTCKINLTPQAIRVILNDVTCDPLFYNLNIHADLVYFQQRERESAYTLCTHRLTFSAF